MMIIILLSIKIAEEIYSFINSLMGSTLAQFTHITAELLDVKQTCQTCSVVPPVMLTKTGAKRQRFLMAVFSSADNLRHSHFSL